MRLVIKVAARRAPRDRGQRGRWVQRGPGDQESARGGGRNAGPVIKKASHSGGRNADPVIKKASHSGGRNADLATKGAAHHAEQDRPQRPRRGSGAARPAQGSSLTARSGS
ncbi:hypothetical protein, partial [Micromonospora zamorensis]|uniref:hypothetical protein n=1 Tax=Micromonospora zamorensis TaxID=709883 RepID=UPI0033DC69C9